LAQGSSGWTVRSMQQFALAVLLGAVFTQLQGCGGDAATTAAPDTAATTAAPTSASPTAPATTFQSGFVLEGMTKEQAENPAVKAAMEEGIATGFGLEASAVTITSITESTSRRLDGRALQSTKLDIAFTMTVPADKVAAATAQALTVAANPTALLDAVKAAVAASDAPQEMKDAMAASTVSGFVTPTVVVDDGSDSGNTTRRLSFAFVTSDEPLIL